MNVTGKYLGWVVAAFVTIFGIVQFASALSAFTISQGGTATTTQVTNGINYFNGTRITSGTKLKYDGNLFSVSNATTTFHTVTTTLWLPALAVASGTFLAVDNNGKVIATSTPSAGTGTVTNIATTYPLTGGPITTTGTIALAFGTTTANSWSSLQTFANSSTTLATHTGATWFTALTASTLLALDNNKMLISSSTIGNNQLQNSTISGVSLGGTLANLSATDNTLTFSGTYTGATARTIGINLGNANTWTALQTINSASTTNFTAGTFAGLPTSASCGGFALGSFCLDTTDNQIQVGTSTSAQPAVFSSYKIWATGVSTTTWAGTTTVNRLEVNFAGFIKDAYCETDAGTLNTQVKIDSTNLTMFNSSTTPNTITFNTNQAFVKGNTLEVDFGTPASSPTKIDCAFNLVQNAT